MNVTLATYATRLRFRFPFRIAHGERTGTDSVLIRLECNGYFGYGEATLPPYLSDTVDSVLQFLELPEVNRIKFPFTPQEEFHRINGLYPGNMPAKAALDMALWELFAQMNDFSMQKALNIEGTYKAPHSYTIGVGSSMEMKQKFEFGLENGFDFFKLKLDGVHDEKIVEDYLSLSDYPFAVDANQAWTNTEEALRFGKLLQDSGCVLLEQPFDKSDREKSHLLMNNLRMPVIADEACQYAIDLPKLAGSFSGINLKLQKCGGITPALAMIQAARALNMKVLIGCMSESSIGCNAAEQLVPLCDWADLDGPFLISNDLEVVSGIKKNDR